MLVDFHSHTRESDGTLAPQALADFMRERGVGVFSITDHDTLSAYGQFHVPHNAVVVSGIEINTTYNENEVHILGYRLPVHEAPLHDVLENNRVERRKRISKVVERLREAGYDITLEDVNAEADGGDVLGRPHVGKALVRKGLVADFETAFRSLLKPGMPGYVPSSHITPAQAIEAIDAAGGVAVLAHPGRLRDYAIIEELVDCGLRGLEVFYPKHDAAQTQHFRDLARRFDLVMSGGSDFHDIRYNKRGVGIEVEREDIAPFLKLVA